MIKTNPYEIEEIKASIKAWKGNLMGTNEAHLERRR